MQKIIYLSFCLLVCGLTTKGQTGFTVSPTKLYFKQSAGTTDAKTITISNNTSGTFVLVCSFNDWQRDSTGQKIFAKTGEAYPNGISNNLKVVPGQFTLTPGDIKTIDVTLQLPPGGDSATKTAMLYLVQRNSNTLEKNADNKVQTNFKYSLKVNVQVYNEPPQMQTKNIDLQDAYLTSALVKTPADTTQKNKRTDSILVKRYTLNAVIKNIGNLVTEGQVRFELTNSKTTYEFKPKPIEFNTMPNDKLVIPQALPADLPKGIYTLDTIVDFGSDQALKVAETEIEIL
jgi:hypothetical protein